MICYDPRNGTERATHIHLIICIFSSLRNAFVCIFLHWFWCLFSMRAGNETTNRFFSLIVFNFCALFIVSVRVVSASILASTSSRTKMSYAKTNRLTSYTHTHTHITQSVNIQMLNEGLLFIGLAIKNAQTYERRTFDTIRYDGIYDK